MISPHLFTVFGAHNHRLFSPVIQTCEDCSSRVKLHNVRSFHNYLSSLYYVTLRMKALRSVETSGLVYPTTPLSIPDDLNLQQYRS